MNLDVYVLSPSLEPLGLVNQFTALNWTNRKFEFGGFELWCPLTPENTELLKEDNLIWIGGEDIGIIETVQKEKDNEDKLSLTVTGRFVDAWLDRFIIWKKFTDENYISNHMRNVVNINVINPTDTKRKIPLIKLNSSQPTWGSKTTYSVNRSNLWESLIALGKVHNLMPRLLANVPAGELNFTVQKFVDRSIEQTTNTPVVLSDELSDILSFNYSYDGTAYRNVALVAGAGEGEVRKLAVVNDDIQGAARRELFVDARDLSDTETWDAEIITTISSGGAVGWWTAGGTFVQEGYREITTVTKKLTHPKTGEVRTSTVTTTAVVSEEPEGSTNTEETTEEVPFPDEVYQGMLKERGRAKLAECLKVQSFNAQVRMTGARAYTYGEDYFLGDRITVEDKELMIRVSTDITEVTQSWSDESYSVTVTLGDAAPTITQLVRRATK